MIHPLTIIFCLGLTFAPGVVHAGPYDALPLRSPLSTEPYFQTSLGREKHRFANSEINRYRLYDFYARQAEYHLAQESVPQLLLPYPGLEGGRRGHWGQTNEKTTSANLDRSQEPIYNRLINRGPLAHQFVCISHQTHQSLCLFERSSPAMSRVLLDTKLHTPEHAFAYKVDRFGFDLAYQGRNYLTGHKQEWHTLFDEPVKVINDGYYLYQDHIIFRRLVDGNALLDMPTVRYHGDIPVYERHLEWKSKPNSLKFPLPIEAELIHNGKIDIRKEKDSWVATISGADRQLTHRVSCSLGVQTLSLHQDTGKIWVKFLPLKAGTTIQMASWISPANTPPAVTIIPKNKKLSGMLGGSSRYFTEDVSVKGTLNADPAASGTAYEIDDIPVPAKNPYGMPMTTSGITFTKDGTAYLCTLVGDIWKVTGLDDKLESVTWQRFASGLNSPLGLEMVDGVLHAITQHQIVQLHDNNNDGEADLIKPFTTVPFPGGRVHDLQRDEKGYFYFGHVSGIHRVSPDGTKIEIISNPARNPFGLGVRPDGLALSDASEGNQSNGTCSIYESAHPENKDTVAKQRRILYLPRGIDNSPGSRIFMNDERFGTLGHSIIGVSYGTGRFYQILRDPNNGSPQAAISMLLGEFSSGSCRLDVNPKDGQIYVTGLDGWGDYATTEGCLHRIRYTGKQELSPVSWKAYRNGISVRFNIPVDPASISADKLFIQQWNYIDSLHSYGSAEYSVKQPGQIGHDHIPVHSIHFSQDHKELFINTPDILPAMCTQIHGKLKSADGQQSTLDLYATLNSLPNKSTKGKPSNTSTQKLAVPYKENNGNTYAILMDFFDKRAGRDSFERPVGPTAPYQKEELNFAWINKNILTPHGCIACHGNGSKYDFSTRDNILKALNLKEPDKSHILGMVSSGSMPPYPMPTVSPEMQKALREWIAAGAKE